MKRLVLFSCIVLIMGVLSCKKKLNEPIPAYPIPEWLQSKITELPPGTCQWTSVNIIEYQGKRYYNIYPMVSSCLYCDLYDINGNYQTWDSNQWNDFYKNLTVVKTLPACP
jgi:hypothetical protein